MTKELEELEALLMHKALRAAPYFDKEKNEYKYSIKLVASAIMKDPVKTVESIPNFEKQTGLTVETNQYGTKFLVFRSKEKLDKQNVAVHFEITEKVAPPVKERGKQPGDLAKAIPQSIVSAHAIERAIEHVLSNQAAITQHVPDIADIVKNIRNGNRKQQRDNLDKVRRALWRKHYADEKKSPAGQLIKKAEQVEESFKAELRKKRDELGTREKIKEFRKNNPDVTQATSKVYLFKNLIPDDDKYRGGKTRQQYFDEHVKPVEKQTEILKTGKITYSAKEKKMVPAAKKLEKNVPGISKENASTIIQKAALIKRALNRGKSGEKMVEGIKKRTDDKIFEIAEKIAKHKKYDDFVEKTSFLPTPEIRSQAVTKWVTTSLGKGKKEGRGGGGGGRRPGQPNAYWAKVREIEKNKGKTEDEAKEDAKQEMKKEKGSDSFVYDANIKKMIKLQEWLELQ